jgi:hypothetical protein
LAIFKEQQREMFSQFSELKNFASKITAELSLDNLQKEQDDDQQSTVTQPPPAQQPPIKQPSSSPIPKTKSISSPSNELNDSQYLIHEKNSQIEFLTKNLCDLQEELIQLKESNERKEKNEKEELEKIKKEKRNLFQDYQLLQTKHHDLELEFHDLQKLYQTKYQQEQQQEEELQQEKEIKESPPLPCESCISYQKQIETVEKNHQLQIENLNKKNSKLQKQNKKFEKELQEAQAQIQALTQAAAALVPKVDEVTESFSERDETTVQSSENFTFSQSLLDEEIQKNSQKEIEIQSLRSQLHDLQRECEELKEKQQTQTTKMKDKVKDFIESQRLLQNEKANLTKMLSAKVDNYTLLPLLLVFLHLLCSPSSR